MNSIFNNNKNLDDIFKEFNTEMNEDFIEDFIKYSDPSPLRISTMTVTCQTNLKINLSTIYEYVDVIDYYDKNKEGILKISYGNHEAKGINKKDIANKKKIKKVFYNQSTIIIQVPLDENKEEYKEVNLKLFTNGSIQMTGLKSVEMGKNTVNILYHECLKMNEYYKSRNPEGDKLAILNPEDYKISNVNIVLINSDFSTHFNIKRDVLHELLTKKYNLRSSYEPCIYPGINCKYYWNSLYNKEKKGICHCNQKCLGKGNGEKAGECRRITIAIFQSGNIIITGARSYEQLQETYQYINSILKENYLEIKRNILPMIEEEDSSDSETKKIKKTIKKKIVLINVDDIKY